MTPASPATASVFAALADPTRREIFEALARSGTATATTLTSDFDISRQAIAKHLSLLSNAGLTVAEKSGRETIYRPDLEPLRSLSAWVSMVESDWSKRLGNLADHLSSDTNEP